MDADVIGAGVEVFGDPCADLSANAPKHTSAIREAAELLVCRLFAVEGVAAGASVTG